MTRPRSIATDILIRAARLTDLERIQEIYAEHVLNGLASFEESPPDLYEMSRRFLMLSEAGLPYFVAAQRDTDSVHGYAYASPYRARSGYRYTVEDSIYLAPRSYGQGLGGLLLKSLIDACTDLGKRQMVAVIGDSANQASVRLHSVQGFTMVGILRSVGFKHGRWVDSVLMQRPLAEGDSNQPSN